MFAKRLSDIAFKFSLCGEPQWVLFNKLSPSPLMRGIDGFSDLLFSNLWSISRKTEFCTNGRDSTERLKRRLRNVLEIEFQASQWYNGTSKITSFASLFYDSTGNSSVSCFLCLISSTDYLKEPFEQVASSLTAGNWKFPRSILKSF